MQTLEEIRRALEPLSAFEHLRIANWLRDLAFSKSNEVREVALAYVPGEPPQTMTLEEYFELEERSEILHEFFNGSVHAMSGPSVAHERVRHRLDMAFSNHLKGRPCEVFASKARLLIQVDWRNISYHPDIMIDCQPESWNGPGLRNPTLVVEVLSPSTENIDKREKAEIYRLVDSIEEYVLVAQDKYELTIHRRTDGWWPQVYRGPDPTVEFRSIALTLPMRSIYDDVLLARG